MGFDLNRHWRDTNPWAQPGLHAVKTYLVQANFKKSSGYPLSLGW